METPTALLAIKKKKEKENYLRSFVCGAVEKNQGERRSGKDYAPPDTFWGAQPTGPSLWKELVQN